MATWIPKAPSPEVARFINGGKFKIECNPGVVLAFTRIAPALAKCSESAAPYVALVIRDKLWREGALAAELASMKKAPEFVYTTEPTADPRGDAAEVSIMVYLKLES